MMTEHRNRKMNEEVVYQLQTINYKLLYGYSRFSNAEDG
jgi:hypothetical protein